MTEQKQSIIKILFLTFLFFLLSLMTGFMLGSKNKLHTITPLKHEEEVRQTCLPNRSEYTPIGRVFNLIITHPDETLRADILRWLSDCSLAFTFYSNEESEEWAGGAALAVKIEYFSMSQPLEFVVFERFFTSELNNTRMDAWGAIVHEYQHLRHLLALKWWKSSTIEITADHAEARLETEYAAYLHQCHFYWSNRHVPDYYECHVLGIEGPVGLRMALVREHMGSGSLSEHKSYLGYVAKRGPAKEYEGENIYKETFEVLPEIYKTGRMILEERKKSDKK